MSATSQLTEPDRREARVTVVGHLDGATLTIVISGELDLAAVPLLSEMFQSYRGRYRLATFELADVTFIDCAGLRALLSAVDGDPLSSRLGVRHASRAVYRLLQLLGMEEIIGGE